MISKTKSSLYRRLFVAYLIDNGINTIPKIQGEINIPRRTAQDTIVALAEVDIVCIFTGSLKNGHYQIESWGPFNKLWVTENREELRNVLGY
ncbi:winged helix-turn-helix domain-containing protein [Vibrio gallicus]|uniref:winged helix-turn-helix domain-containing protein n=1 Tax=Vibrio gallicus TaxID=190897 RepID=UPI0021C2C7F9|nr:winged helix-turn-helix domain-containing protein [Vibrio gallicus]